MIMYDKLINYLDRQDECKNLQYFVIKHKSGLFDIYLGCGKKEYNLKKIELELNSYASEGWQLVFQVLEKKRFWLFWSREAVIITLGR